jgi:bifunctional non-homologous end joining protein LigD
MATKKAPKRRGVTKKAAGRKTTAVAVKKARPVARAVRKAKPLGGAAPAGEFTHVEKVMFPDAGYTKGELLAYYDAVAELLIPHLRGRPLTLERLPDGVGGPESPHFWQKNTPAYYPKSIPRARLTDRTGKGVDYALVEDRAALLYLVNQGAITFHVWPSRVGSLDRPDYVLFDLDPGRRPFSDAVLVAKEVRRVLESAGVESFPKTSGKSGLHVLVPWTQDGDYDAARAWALEAAEEVVRRIPDVATLERRIDARGGRLYLDVMQNARGHHAVPPYVVRAVPAATVSTPLEWGELNARLTPGRFDLKTALKRFDAKGDLMGALAEG